MKRTRGSKRRRGQRGIKAIARRVSTLAQVYEHLLGNEMTRTTDFGSYVKSLCLSLAEIQAGPDGAVTLTCDSDTLHLDLDTVTALGIVEVKDRRRAHPANWMPGASRKLEAAHALRGSIGR